jgi:hypothetical protein
MELRSAMASSRQNRTGKYTKDKILGMQDPPGRLRPIVSVRSSELPAQRGTDASALAGPDTTPPRTVEFFESIDSRGVPACQGELQPVGFLGDGLRRAGTFQLGALQI